MFDRLAYIFAALLILDGQVITAQTPWRANAAGTSSQGSIHGTVKDNTGGIIPGAVLTLTGQRADERTETTKDDGTFRFTRVDPGTYLLTADSSGLQPLHTVVVKVKARESALANMIMVVKPSNGNLWTARTKVH